MIKVDVFSGFLGAGKTTLIQKLLEEVYKNEKVIFIENEYGEVRIDAQTLTDTDLQIQELTSGCICCSTSGDFTKTLKDVAGWLHPERVLIEPSGVGKLSDILRMIENANTDRQLELQSVITVVNARKLRSYAKNLGAFYLDQIQHAQCVLLSHTETLPSEKIDEAVQFIHQKNCRATVFSVPLEQLSGAQILAAAQNER